MVKNIDQLIETLFEGFNPKQRKVLACRFGLQNGKKVTLQSVGDDLGITRERVRQIEEQSLKKLSDRAKKEATMLIEPAVAHLEKMQGVRRDDQFIQEVKENVVSDYKNIKYPDQKIRFILLAAQAPLFEKESDDMHAFWYTNNEAKNRFDEFVSHNTQAFQKKKLAPNDIKVSFTSMHGFSTPEFLLISKKFKISKFGDMGLADWAHINPRTIRDKAYLVLRKEGSPLHFQKIAQLITNYGLDKRAAHTQTVHNELIKDQRFVLVGRGIYALRENGYEAGTVREVVQRLLTKHGALTSNEVVQFVNQQRILKTNTILLSLQNKRYFKRLENGKYHVKQA